ncbi:MAG: protein kinase [Parachlamydiales bacterium]|nr:protein kinase [Parachlamydiales bacterium]
MAVRAYFSDQSRLLFEPLGPLRDASKFWVRFNPVSAENPDGMDVIDIKTNQSSRVAIDGMSFFFRLNLGSDPSQYHWRGFVPHIVNTYRTIYNKLEYARRKARPKIDCSCQFVPKRRVWEMAGRIAMSIIYFSYDHVQAKESDLPVGFYVFSGSTLRNAQVFINFRDKVLGEGDFRTYKCCFELMSGQFCAKGSTDFNPKDAERETNILLDLSGKPGLVYTYRCCVSRGDKYVVFQQLHASTLHEAIFRNRSRLSETVKLEIVKELLLGLNEIAKLGVHFDIAAKNTLVSRFHDRVKAVITDFGSFHPYSEKMDLDFSEVYLPSPELLKGKYTSAYDVWKLGILFYELFTEKGAPGEGLEGAARDEMVSKLQTGWLKMGEETPPRIVELIHKMTEPDLEKRFTASQALAFFLQGEP